MDGTRLTRVHGNLLDSCHRTKTKIRDGSFSTSDEIWQARLDFQRRSRSTRPVVAFGRLVHGESKGSLRVNRRVIIKARRLPSFGEELIFALSVLLHLSRGRFFFW